MMQRLEHKQLQICCTAATASNATLSTALTLESVTMLHYSCIDLGGSMNWGPCRPSLSCSWPLGWEIWGAVQGGYSGLCEAGLDQPVNSVWTCKRIARHAWYYLMR